MVTTYGLFRCSVEKRAVDGFVPFLANRKSQQQQHGSTQAAPLFSSLRCLLSYQLPVWQFRAEEGLMIAAFLGQKRSPYATASFVRIGSPIADRYTRSGRNGGDAWPFAPRWTQYAPSILIMLWCRVGSFSAGFYDNIVPLVGFLVELRAWDRWMRPRVGAGCSEERTHPWWYRFSQRRRFRRFRRLSLCACVCCSH